jgi:hypothetical protein
MFACKYIIDLEKKYNLVYRKVDEVIFE